MFNWKDYYVRNKDYDTGHLHCQELCQARKINELIRGQIWERNYTVKDDRTCYASDKFIEEIKD